MFTNMQEVREANARINHYWFSPGTMKFFKSKVESELINGRYFISSEKQPRSSNPRMFTIREVKEDGTINTSGEFQQFKTRAQALKAAYILAMHS